jgi:ComF family protein
MNPMIKGLTLLSTRIKQKVNSALLTERCVSCLAPTTDHGLCAACRSDLPANTPACPRCALPLPDSATGLCCGDCLRDPPPFARARIPWRYEFPVDRMIGRYKYQGQRKYGRPLMAGLARHLEEALAREPDCRPEALIAAPMHPARRRQRGFNQAQDLAEYLGRTLDLPVLRGRVHRTRRTPTQRGLDRAGRLANLNDSLSLTGEPPASVAIVDDVVTTGATARALASLLKSAGTQRVELWALARTPAPVSPRPHPAVSPPAEQWPDWR